MAAVAVTEGNVPRVFRPRLGRGPIVVVRSDCTSAGTAQLAVNCAHINV